MSSRANVIWLNEPSDEGWEIAIASVQYHDRETDSDMAESEVGGERLLGIRSHAAILIELPRRKKRAAVLGPVEK